MALGSDDHAEWEVKPLQLCEWSLFVGGINYTQVFLSVGDLSKNQCLAFLFSLLV